MFTSIKTRLTAVTVSIVVIAMFTLALANFMTMRSSTIESINTQMDQISEARSNAIADWVKAQRAVVSSIKRNATAADLLPFVQSAETAGSFELAYIGFADKRAVFSKASSIRPANYDPTSRPWYKQAMEANGPILTKPYIAASSGKLVVTFAEPAPEANGVVAADVLLDSVVNIVLAVKPTPRSYAFLVDGSGQIIAHPDQKLALKPATDMHSDLTRGLMQDIATTHRSKELDIKGQAALLHVSKIAGTDWMLAVVLDKAEASEALSGVMKSSLVTAVLAAGIAAAVLGLLIAKMLSRMTTVRDALEDIASGDRDLTRRLDAGGQDELAQIANAFNNFADQIAQVLVDIRGASDSVKAATKEIADGNLDLSSRTEQQADSLQETASAMEELTSTVKQNADSARQANKLAETASHVAVQGGEVVSNVVTTMTAISEASQKIHDIIGVIDGIAFQTNILALNAAVEAARAGEQGRGFAVVAAEVRTLAQRSANAAKEIKELIGDSVAKVRTGTALVDEAGKTMDEVVNSVKRVTDIMGEILAATEEQSAGIEQINLAIGQMDSVTQQNAALVEEAAAAAAAMQEQAAALAEIVDAFKLGHFQNAAHTVRSAKVAARTPLSEIKATAKLQPSRHQRLIAS